MSTIPQTRLDLAVEVLIAGTWHEGTLVSWRKDGDRWTGLVRYSTGVGDTHTGWFNPALIATR